MGAPEMTAAAELVVLYCRQCGKPIPRGKDVSRYLKRRYCSAVCSNRGTKAGQRLAIQPPSFSAPDIRLDDPNWPQRAACRSVDPELFFHPDRENGAARTRRDDRAKAVCCDCPVLADCRRYALAAPEPFGVWGALSETERADIRARREAGARASNHVDIRQKPKGAST